jgi:gluconolactonase
MHPITIYQEEIKNYIRTDFELELLNDTCSFSEGPVWNKEGYYLFSDIPNNIIGKIIPGKPKEVYLQKSGCSNVEEAELSRMMGSNGLAYDADKNLFICQHGNHAIAKYDGKTLVPFITSYQNKKLNSPNDIVVAKDGSIFFSDPPYGLKDQKISPEKYQSLAGFYCWRNETVELFCDKYQYPNGICISADGEFLYTCSNKPFEAFVLEFHVNNLTQKRVVCQENSDGIKCDAYGNLYLCNKEGIIIVDKKGKRMGLIQLPTIPANCCWGGNGLKDLFICARENIFLIKALQK